MANDEFLSGFLTRTLKGKVSVQELMDEQALLEKAPDLPSFWLDFKSRRADILKAAASDVAFVDSYIQTISQSKTQHASSAKEDTDLRPIEQAILAKLDFSMRFQLIQIPASLSYDACKDLARRISLDLLAPNEVEKTAERMGKQVQGDDRQRAVFLSSENYADEGTISSSIFARPKAVDLVTIYETTEDVTMNFFSDGTNHKASPIGKYAVPFYFARFFSNESKSEIILLSTNPIPMGEVRIRGMEVTLRDVSQIGDNCRLPSAQPIVLLHSIEPVVRQIDSAVVDAEWKGKTHEEFAKQVFGGYRHPFWFEKLILAWLFGGKISGFPLHLGILATAGTGKSYLEECLQTQFQESSGISSPGRLKGLVPSFGGTLPNEGYLCRCKRVALVDEFFGFLRMSGGTDKNEIDSGTELMLNILEHKIRRVECGRGEAMSITPNPTAKVMLVTNCKTYYKLKNMVEFAQNVNNAFIGRTLWYVQNQAHIDFINKNKPKIIEAEQEAKDGKLYPIRNPRFVELFDFFYNTRLPINALLVDGIQKKGLALVPEGLAEVYSSRGVHHIACLADGIAKYNYLTFNRQKLEILLEDYEEAEELYFTVVGSWNEGVNLMRLPVKSRVHYLPLEYRELLGFVEQNCNCTIEEIERYFADPKAWEKARWLEEREMIYWWKDANGTAHAIPFWHQRVKEAAQSKA